MSSPSGRWPQVRYDAIGDAWALYKRHWLIWSLAVLVAMVGFSVVAGTLVAFLERRKVEDPGGFSLTFFPGAGPAYLISIMFNGFFTGGMIRMASRQLREGEPRLEDFFSISDVWFDLLLVSLLYGLATMVGAFFCLIPGLILSGLFMLALPLVVDARLPATAALIQSFYALKRQFVTATIFHLVLIMVAYAGFLFCFVGGFLTAPLYSLAITILYRDFFPAGSPLATHKPATPFPEL